ncbi:MAG: methyltransferase domain-containing protein [Hamadaea sp.]|uniref:class I SAM-dependent methyltransferase n=1 Tax=Hamadaea sp. TaxID=2024425 RepID=UPI00180B7298|nr:class I SAM-dependent methyltransferase [Hamadaea sp.]NUR70146.1 methyltransferase domain-containing protein [Hamadaea sp.]NUT23540.1 methyltransferase domain-containing protein [Hamadaea sp.]
MTDCVACGAGTLVEFADLGGIPVLCGVHYATQDEAVASPLGRMLLGYCENCAYVRNLGFDPQIMVYDTTMDTNLHHSAAFRSFSTDLVEGLAERHELAGRRILDIGCGQGEFLRELCEHTGATGFGFDPMYAGTPGSDPSGAFFVSGRAPLDEPDQLPDFDFVTSRHWFEHEDDPGTFLSALRERAGDHEVRGYLEVPDAGYDLATAGWEVIYPHVSYFDSVALAAIVERSGWHVIAEGTWFSGMFRYIEFSTRPGDFATPDRTAARDRQLVAVRGFAERHRQELDRWHSTLAALRDAGQRPVLWGAGSRGVQFLTQVDPKVELSAVVDVNPRKWGRYLPVTGHRVDPPESLREIRPGAVVITNPAYTAEIARSLAELGLDAQILTA